MARLGPPYLLLLAEELLVSALQLLLSGLQPVCRLLQEPLLRHRHAVFNFDFSNQTTNLPLQLLDDAVSLEGLDRRCSYILSLERSKSTQ